MSKYGTFPGWYFPLFSPNAEKYGPEKTPYLDTFHTVCVLTFVLQLNGSFLPIIKNKNVKYYTGIYNSQMEKVLGKKKSIYK